MVKTGFDDITQRMATKDDLKGMATKEDLGKLRSDMIKHQQNVGLKGDMIGVYRQAEHGTQRRLGDPHARRRREAVALISFGREESSVKRSERVTKLEPFPQAV